MFRLDVGNLKPATVMPDGRMLAEGFLTRSGVFTYRMPDGSERKEYRPPEEVFKAESLETFKLVPVTDDHPPTLLNAENARQYAVGSVGETIRKDGDFVAASLVIHDAKTIAKMRSGKVQLSCGYDVDLVETPGVTEDGQRYDAVQTNIRGNHVALVQIGRAGSAARVRLDCGIMSVESSGVEFMEEALKQLSSAMAQIAELQARADKAEKELIEVKARADKAEALADAEKARADKAESARKDSEDGFLAAVKSRVALETEAAKVLVGEELGDLSDREIKVAVVRKLDGIEITDETEEFLKGAYKLAMARKDKSTEALAGVREVVEQAKRNDSADKEAEAMKKLRQETALAWMKG